MGSGNRIDLVAGGDLGPLSLQPWAGPPYTLKRGSSLLPQACRASLKTACRHWLIHFLKVIGQAWR